MPLTSVKRPKPTQGSRADYYDDDDGGGGGGGCGGGDLTNVHLLDLL